jgi:signal transduction histidine kinase/CheY-like chemotaxis protein/HPt (histidine-containing phosphotransfer) domain-containing protein
MSMSRKRASLSHALDSGLVTPILLCGMGVALWFAARHWHEQAWTVIGMACIAALSIADLRRHRRQAGAQRRLLRASEENAKEARMATEAKGRFLAMMSHEIRTPMNGVLGMVDLLGETPLDADQRVLLSRCRESSVALLAIINDILDFSKIEAGKLELEARPVALRALVDQVCGALATEATQRRVLLSAHVDAAVPRQVSGDPVRLRQVLVNLVGNAVKFSQGGRVDVRVDVVGPAVRLRVQDTGIGMTPEVMDGLFRPFEQADAATTRRFGGTGLGLSIVKRLVECMSGDVTCDSTPGVGTCFTVRLPLPAWTAAHGAFHVDAPHAIAPLPRGLHTLLAEDHPINREVIVRQLAKLGWTCDCAEDGEIAWTLLSDPMQAARYAMLITDCHMPNLDGYGLVQRLRACEAADGRARLPVVALTANALQGERERCLALGMDGYLTKPLQVHELQAVLSGVLVQETKIDEAATPYAFLYEVCGGQVGDVVDLLRTALAPGDADLGALQGAVAANDSDGVRDLAHRLVSVARQLGEDATANALAELQALAADAQPMVDAHARAARALRDAFARAQAFVDAHAGGGS